jgi:hypothetical protein
VSCGRTHTGGEDAVADGAQGWLYFKHSSKKWLSHHFVLTKDWLTYYKNQKVKIKLDLSPLHGSC